MRPNVCNVYEFAWNSCEGKDNNKKEVTHRCLERPEQSNQKWMIVWSGRLEDPIFRFQGFLGS